MTEKDPASPVLDEDDSWWREAEKRARRDVAASRRKARLRRSLRWLPNVGLTVLVVSAIVVAVNKSGLPHFHWPKTESVAASGRLLPETLEGDPYTGTPAEKYDLDTDGIRVPAATALGTHSVGEVRSALATTKTLIVLSRFDQRTVVDRDVKPFLAALAPTVRKALETENPRLVLASRLAPGEKLLAPPRATGTMVAQLGKNGEIAVVTKYVFVYPLRPALPVRRRSDTHVIVRADVTFSFATGARFAPEDRGVWLLDGAEYWYNISCDQAAKGLLALPKLSDADVGLGGEPAAAGVDHYVPTGAVPSGGDCARSPSATPSPST